MNGQPWAIADTHIQYRAALPYSPAAMLFRHRKWRNSASPDSFTTADGTPGRKLKKCFAFLNLLTFVPDQDLD